ncbi:ribulokinase [Flagellimonas sp.]|uniref:ribulokinase n=1 Tax=Flagellimonas sp. TaxID=2058762 RepID=UPI003BACC808
MVSDDYVIGVDFGTGSVRALLANAQNGNEIAVSEFEFPRWKKGMYCDSSKNRFRQHPLDYMEGLEHTVREVVAKADRGIVENVRAITVDTTGSTPVAVDRKGVPLALNKAFEHNPNAMFFLWKDHTAIQEAHEINEHSKKFAVDYLKYAGGIYSPEWFWAKLLHVLREDAEVAKACASWVEHCDWMPFLLTGGTDIREMKRGVCAAGHKALWSEAHGGLPPKDFFVQLDPLMDKLQHPLFARTYGSDTIAGKLSPYWAEKLGLPINTLVGVGALDAHVGAVGGQIEPYYLSKVMGTSTCDMMVAPSGDGIGLIKGICGQVDGSIVPGMVGFEAGQSAFGDVYAWFQDLLTATTFKAIRDSDIHERTKEQLLEGISKGLLERLGEEASRLPLSMNSELAMDWFNGRRTPEANPYVKGALLNLNLGSDAARIYRALVESTCFGAKRIVEHFGDNNVPLKGIIALGGVARKSNYVMQMMADVLDLPIKVHNAEQTCAMGAAMLAATVAGVHQDVQEAMGKMGHGFRTTYHPNGDRTALYGKRYELYKSTANFLQDTCMGSITGQEDLR